MFNLIKKDFLIVSRTRSVLLLLLAMPIILLTILGFALGGIMSGEVDINAIPIALVVENDFEDDKEDFKEALYNEKLPEEVIQQIISSSYEADPSAIFLDILESLDEEEIIDLRYDYSAKQAEEAIKEEEVSAIITIPKRFSYNTLMSLYLDKESDAAIKILIQNKEDLSSIITESIVTGFTDQYNLELSVLQATGGVPIDSEISDDFGEVTYMPRQRPVSSFQYYTVGMAVFFALYVASTISSHAYIEKSTFVFARLMLTGERPIRYLISKGLSATVISFVQLSIIYVGSSLVFQTFSGISGNSLIWMAVTTLIYSFTIGALATLLTAIVLQFNSNTISNVFSGFLISAIAFIGGSMIPVEEISPVISKVGNWTPNGAMMTAYLQLIQGFEFSDILAMVYRVVLMMVIFIVLALAIFPKRRLI